MVEIPPSYIKVSIPKKKKSSNESTPIKTHILVESINLIDTTEMVMELTIKITMKWTDGRLIFRNLPNSTKSLVPSRIADQLWLPLDNVVHDNAMIGKIHRD